MIVFLYDSIEISIEVNIYTIQMDELRWKLRDYKIKRNKGLWREGQLYFLKFGVMVYYVLMILQKKIFFKKKIGI